VHPETLICEQVVALLVAAATVAGSNVFPSRKTNLRPNEKPAIAVYMLETDSELYSEAPRIHKRTATMGVELILDSGVNIDDVDKPMNAFRLQVEHVLDYERDLLNEAENLLPTGMSKALIPSGDRVSAHVLMSYAVTYVQCAPEPASAVPFEKAQTIYNLNNAVDPGDQVEDCVILEGDQS
jgi:hypothetical protein